MKIVQFLILLVFCTSVLFAQTQTSKIFYTGKGWPTDIFLWTWGFSELPVEVPDMGYTPGTPAMKWGTELNWRDRQGLFFGYNNGLDLSIAEQGGFVHFRLRAPNGVSAGESVEIWLYDSRWYNWDYAVYYNLEDDKYQELNDGGWHSFIIPVDSFKTNLNDINKKDISAVSFETSVNTNSDQFYIDDVWIGSPKIRMTMTLYDGMNLTAGVGSDVKGFSNNNLVISEGEGFSDGTNAIVWEDNIVNGYQNAGIGFTFNPQDFSHEFNGGTSKIKMKIKAPADIHDLMLVWKDHNENFATILVDTAWIPDSVWNGEWQSLQIPLDSFIVDPGLNMKDIYYFSISPANTAISDRILIDDIWVGEPVIDNLPPPEPADLSVNTDKVNLNYISWENIPTQEGESYNIYSSSEPIYDLNDDGVTSIAVGVPEGVDNFITFAHHIYYPLEPGRSSYYYAVETVDAAGRFSENFVTIDEAFTNEGKARGLISIDADKFNADEFQADGNLNEWSSFFKNDIEIVTRDSTIEGTDSTIVVEDTILVQKDVMFFKMRPEPGKFWGSINGPLDYSADVYIAMDDQNIYLAIDVVDDVFSYREENTQPWWEDEAVELYLGLYELKFMHNSFQRGVEPDYRIVFRPDSMLLPDQSTIPNGFNNYYFEIPDDSTGYDSSYVIEAKIPFETIQFEGDEVFTPVEGMTIPFEVFATDSDIPDGGAEGKLQLGDHWALNPWGDGPKVWTFAWIGMPVISGADDAVSIPFDFSLSQNYPNPFNPSTTINFTVAKTANVRMDVYNVLGEKVTTLVETRMNAGNYSVVWNGHDNSGRLAASGVYFYRLISGQMMKTKKMLLLK